MASLNEPKEAGTVPVRVQVVDTEPRVIDPTVPTYLDAADLTQRIARDAGLGGWWEDGSRRGFGLWARGRLVRENERLADVPIVPYELMHLLPEPRRGTGIQERPLGLLDRGDPPSRMSKVMRVLYVLVWTTLWATALDARPTPLVAWTGAFVLPVLVLGAVRGVLWGQLRWPAAWALAGIALFATAPLAFGVVSAPEALRVYVVLATALGLMVGSTMAWLVWLGPLALPDVAEDAVAPVIVAASTCAVCGGPVGSDVIEACAHGCGRTFHRGCLRARQSVATGPGCAVCGAEVRA